MDGRGNPQAAPSLGLAKGAVRPRAVVLGLVLGLGLCAVTPYNNVYLNGTPLGGGHFPLVPFLIFLILAVVSAVWRKATGGRLLTGLEAMTVWALTTLVSGIGYTGLFRTFFINLTAPIYFASQGNRWGEILRPLLPGGLYPTDQAAVELLYNGLENGRGLGWLDILARIPWSAWSAPLLSWGLFILLAWLVMLCLVNLFSRQWIVNERMNFPLLRVPQLMNEALEEDRLFGFLTDRWLVVGLVAAVLLHAVNGAAFYYPAMPQVPTLVLVGQYFPKTGLFSGFYKLKIHIIPAFIGFAFLTSRQISLSFWLFYFLGGMFAGVLSVSGYQIPAAALGVTFGPTLSRPEETQMIGAYAVFFLFILWLARFHLREAALSAVGRGARSVGGPDGERAEWISPGLSLWGAGLGFAGLVAWCAAFGMSVWASALVLASFFVFMLVTTRVICQGGIPYYTLVAAPLDSILGWLGSGVLGGAGLVVAAAAQKALFVDVRESVMPSMLHAAKAGEGARRKGLLFGAVGLALLGGLVVAGAAMLALCHKYGLREMEAEWAVSTTTDVYESVRRLAETPAGPWNWTMTFSAVGAFVMAVLVLCYQRFTWWPLHPIGYLAAYSSGMHILWFSFLVGWICNHLALRYGGVNALKLARSLFIGLIIGDFLMGGIFAGYGFFAGSSYQVLPN